MGTKFMKVNYKRGDEMMQLLDKVAVSLLQVQLMGIERSLTLV